ncbi:hypothetical protein GCM10017776_32560 [Streptomyces griseoluteus]|nr:hypothetical protein GCM10017776_32560 [Streptomyces griseoluteus]
MCRTHTSHNGQAPAEPQNKALPTVGPPVDPARANPFLITLEDLLGFYPSPQAPSATPDTPP